MASLMGQKDATWRQKFRYLAGTLVNVIFPPVCASCKSMGELFCSKCQENIRWVTEPVCIRCGRPQAASIAMCQACIQNPLPLLQIRTAVIYAGSVAEVIKQFKYEGYFGLAGVLGELMLQAWTQWALPVDLVIPIPLHTARLRERGYNQSEMLARFLERYLDWHVETAALKRFRRTRPQVGLNMVERRANVRGAFVADPSLVSNKRILLIDDVRTTGATLAAAADVLLAAGAASVSAYCLAEADSTILSLAGSEENLKIFNTV